MLVHILLEILLPMIILIILFFLSKSIFWEDIKEVIRLNQETSRDKREPEQIIRVASVVILKLIGFVIFWVASYSH